MTQTYIVKLHPLIHYDIDRIASWLLEQTEDPSVVERRIDEIDRGIEDIIDNPTSGMRIFGDDREYLVRHFGQSKRITIVFHTDTDRQIISILHVSFGGENWQDNVLNRLNFIPDNI